MTLRSLTSCLLLALCSISAAAQSSKQFLVSPDPASVATDSVTKSAPPDPSSRISAADVNVPTTAIPQLRVERLPIASGGELLTIFGRLDGMKGGDGSAPEVPLISVVRDTLNDNDPENDRLRYVWMLTHTQPTLMKRIASAIPFLYQHVGNKKQASKGLPTPILDLANTSRQTWNHF